MKFNRRPCRSVFSMSLGRHLHDKGITQVKLAELAGTSPSTINSYISGKKGISLDSFLRICKALEVEPNYLLGYRGQE